MDDMIFCNGLIRDGVKVEAEVKQVIRLGRRMDGKCFGDSQKIYFNVGYGGFRGIYYSGTIFRVILRCLFLFQISCFCCAVVLNISKIIYQYCIKIVKYSQRTMWSELNDVYFYFKHVILTNCCCVPRYSVKCLGTSHFLAGYTVLFSFIYFHFQMV